MSNTCSYFHVVWCTKSRINSLTNELREDVYRFIWHEVSKHKCVLKRIGGTPNHLHLLIDLYPAISLSELIGKVKSASSAWLRRDEHFPLFNGWGREYFAVSVSPSDATRVIEYINDQQNHHILQQQALDEEFHSLYRYAGFKYDPSLPSSL